MTGDVDQVRTQALGDLPRRTAARYPTKTALVDRNVRVTFEELDAVIGRATSGLSAAGLQRGDRLALLSHNCWQFVVLSFATARLGVVLVPINFMLGANEVGYILEHSGATAFVVEDSLLQVAEAAIALSPTELPIRAVIQPSGAEGTATWQDVEEWFRHEGQAPAVLVRDDDPVRIMYTSGTESRPKGVLLTSRSLLWQYVSCIVDGQMGVDDVELHALPMYHCAQLDCFLGPDVYLGATSVILSGPDPATILRTIEVERITKFFAPPTVWISLLRHPDFDRTDLSSLRKGYYGASPMPVEVLSELRRRLPDVSLWNFYGQTEMAPLATILGPDEQLSGAGSAGRACLNTETRIVSATDDSTAPLMAGEVGEIVHRSPHATLGYYMARDKTAEAFRDGWFHSGDLGFFDDVGRLFVVDRKKDMIKTGGENVSSREVEEAIYQLDGVAEVAVFGVQHPRWVEAVVAVVVPKDGAELTPESVMSHARGLVATFKAPKYVAISDALPKNPSGKILKRQLREDFADLVAAESTQ